MRYQLSERENVRFWAKVQKTPGCWIWTGAKFGKGYGQFKAGTKKHGAHRIAYTLGGRSIPAGLFVLHSCDTPACVRPSHLYVGDHLRNMQDRKRRGRIARGERVHGCKLTRGDVRRIREEWAGLERGPSGRVKGGGLAGIAEREGLKPATVRDIGKRRIWRWLH